LFVRPAEETHVTSVTSKKCAPPRGKTHLSSGIPQSLAWCTVVSTTDALWFTIGKAFINLVYGYTTYLLEGEGVEMASAECFTPWNHACGFLEATCKNNNGNFPDLFEKKKEEGKKKM